MMARDRASHGSDATMERSLDEGSICTSCNKGSLVKARVRKMNGFLVVVGFLLFIPAVIGLLVGTFGALGSGFVASQSKRPPEEIRAELKELKVPDATIDRVMNGEGELGEDLKGLNQEQQSAVLKARVAKFGKDAPAGIMVGSMVGVAVVSILVGVVGFILIGKKWVLQCTECPAVLPAG
jgi:hypothetical protein